MSNPNLNRVYLKSLATQTKNDEVSRIIALFLPALQFAAKSGQTSYLFDMTNMHQVPFSQTVSLGQQRTSYSIPLPELVPLIQAQFHDCKVSLQESTIHVNATTTVNKKGLLIDWS